MSIPAPSLERPRRWDAPFNPDFPAAEIERLLTLSPFREMNLASFPRSAPLADILRNDTTLRTYKAGELIVRERDYGTSAFLILSGRARVVLAPDLPPAAVGRNERTRPGLLRSLAQLWTNSREDEAARRRQSRKLQNHSVFLQDIPRVLDEYKTAAMQAGDFFGEIAALSRMPRTASIFAEVDETQLLEIRWQGLRDLLKYDPALRNHVDKIYRQRALATYLEETPFLRHLSPEARAAVEAATQFETYGEYDWSGEYKKLVQAGSAAVAKEPLIASEGDYPNGIIMIRSGFARLTQRHGAGHRTLNYLGAGSVYGLAEIAHNYSHPDDTVSLQHSLRVIGHTHILTIPAAIIAQYVLPSMPADARPAPIAQNTSDARPAAAKKARDRSASPAVDSAMMEFLTQNRLFNGTKSMVIDLDRCTRCDDCVRACAATHDNNPRFLRHGPIHDSLMVAQACMHCTDPICMIGCPTGAIHRDSFGGEVVINADTCIGCTVCANNCPYGSIRMVEVRDETGRALLAQDAKPILKATKCDLCLDQLGGPACVRACPHDALDRINLNSLDPLTKWLTRL
ncbi:MAG: 4Fe-4S dicluster domain-containing protein [Verrucomicrobia bacterium]|nr:4Fe-4S dicluster domain-containing protein [Verrucomicrobiota bacterium]